jgi:flagellar protein FliO/FliZ
MTQTFFAVIGFLILLALLPFAIRWIQRRVPAGASASSTGKIVSAMAVGPHQRVVTIEVGPEGARTWLVLGVTAQAITCLHSVSVSPTHTPVIKTTAPGALPTI